MIVSVSLMTAIVLGTATPGEVIQSAVGNFQCMPIEKINQVSGGTDRITVNNFVLSEKESPLAPGQTELSLSFSVVNRSDKPVFLSGQFVGLGKDNEQNFVLSTPTWGSASPQSTQTIRSAVFVARGTLLSVRHICAEIMGNFER
ncbi:MAG TPA: hypothetical protein DFK19_09505 [Ochrobactrum sp.]|nr:hypothetical protein [Ochrobactrum sp.]